MSTANKSDNELSSVEKKFIKELVSNGREKGFVTIDEINESLGDETPSPEQLEKIFKFFGEEKDSKRIAYKIIKERKIKEIDTQKLVKIIE